MISQLKQLGLTDKEAQVYLAALELGPSSVLEISKKAGINRPTTYLAIETLIKRGLVSSFLRGKKRYFSAESPDRLLSLLKVKGKELEEQEREFRKALPNLENIYNLSGEKPKVRFYEGKEGIRAIQEDIIKSKPERIDEIFSVDPAYKMFPPHPRDHRRRISKKVKLCRVIYTSKKGAILSEKEGSKERRYIPFKEFPFLGEMVIYKNKLVLLDYEKEVIGVVIESEEISKTLRVLFDLAWRAARKV